MPLKIRIGDKLVEYDPRTDPGYRAVIARMERIQRRQAEGKRTQEARS